MTEKLSANHELRLTIACDLINQAAIILGWIDDEIQSEGSTGPNPINYVEDDLKNTIEYIKGWIADGVDL